MCYSKKNVQKSLKYCRVNKSTTDLVSNYEKSINFMTQTKTPSNR